MQSVTEAVVLNMSQYCHYLKYVGNQTDSNEGRYILLISAISFVLPTSLLKSAEIAFAFLTLFFIYFCFN